MASDPKPGQEGPYSEPPPANEQISGLVFALILVDPDGKVAQVNHAAENILGTSAKRILGRPFSKFVIPDDPRVAHRLDTAENALVARDVSARFGASEVQVNLTMSPLAGHPGWRVVTLSHLSAEDRLGEAHLGSTAGAPSILAHEIKNPLSAIRGAAQLAARKLPHADKRLARMITDEVDRIARLIDRMQQLGSRQQEPVAPCNLHEAVRAAIATVRAGGAKDVVITEEFDPSLPPVLANRDALEQVLINLISNGRDAAAADAGLGESGTITVKTRYVSGLVFSAIRFGRAVRLPIEITVTDNGAGLDPAVKDRLFEPFVSSKPSGQGLGLALVRKLVRDMDGSISHERNSHAGLTHFRLHLPMAR